LFLKGGKPLSSQLKEKSPGSQLEDTALNAQQIDELLERKQAKAEKYASEPERFTLFSLELEMKSTHGNRLILYGNGQLSCNCEFFEEWGRCSHSMATLLLLKDTLL
jgi:hypothetical protein